MKKNYSQLISNIEELIIKGNFNKALIQLKVLSDSISVDVNKELRILTAEISDYSEMELERIADSQTINREKRAIRKNMLAILDNLSSDNDPIEKPPAKLTEIHKNSTEEIISPKSSFNFKYLKNSIGKNQLAEVFSQLDDLFQNDSNMRIENDYLLLLRSFNSYKENVRRGLSDNSENQITLQRISARLLELIIELETNLK